VLGGAMAGANSDEKSPRAGSVSIIERHPALAAQADLDRAVGARIITAIDGVSPNAALVNLARRGRIGGVILFARNIRSVAQVRRDMRRLQAAAPQKLLVMVDQEGGTVKRFASLPPSTSPRRMKNPGGEGAATAKALRNAGVNVDLAPVADVTANPSSFLFSRTFARASGTCAFANGLAANGVKPTLKHFPGLGGAPANTDDASVTLHASRRTLTARAKAYRACGKRGLVMLSNARYAAFGSVPALMAPAVYRFLRTFTKAPTISDSLQAAALRGTAHVPIRAVQAGLDFLLTTGSQRTAEELYLGLRGGLSARQIMAGAERIAAFRRQLT
jgi:beta-N-acetylhexosaminidase